MKKSLLTILTMGLALLSGCGTLPLVGSFENFNEVFVGKVHWNGFFGTSRIEVEGKNTGAKGKGSSWVTYIPPTLSCEGQKGEALLTLDDGRVVKAQWVGLSCTSGWGTGTDQGGNEFTFKFGMNKRETQAEIDRRLQQSKYKPDIPPPGEEPLKYSQETTKSGISPKVSEPIEFEYDAETKTGYISVKGKGPEARAWMLRQIEEICTSKNIIIQKGTTSEPAHFRILDETFLDGKFTIKFEVVR
jgi:hypothetical protein